MKMLMLVTAGLGIAGGANAQILQSKSPTVNVLSAGDNYMIRTRSDGDRVISSHNTDPDTSKTCLDSKVTGATVCHTRAEWEKIAADIERRQR